MTNILHDVSTSVCVSDYSEFTAIIACVGVGNVSQLACDLLIYNCGFRLVSNVYFKYIPSAVGSDPYIEACSSRIIATCCQLFVNKDKHLVVLQSRSPPFPGCRKKHVQEIVDFLSAMNFSRVVLLSNSFGAQRNDAELTGAQLRYAVAGLADENDLSRLEALNLTSLTPQKEQDLVELGMPKPATTFYLPGAGLSGLLFDQLVGRLEKPVFLLNLFTSEGDNASDAVSVAWTVSEWLGLSQAAQSERKEQLESLSATGWRAPTSWKMLYGLGAVGSLY